MPLPAPRLDERHWMLTAQAGLCILSIPVRPGVQTCGIVQGFQAMIPFDPQPTDRLLLMTRHQRGQLAVHRSQEH